MAAPPEIRLFRLADMDRIAEIEAASFGRDAYDRNLFAEFFHKCGGLFLAAEWRGVVRGYCVTCLRGERAEIVSIAVDPRFREHGIATALMDSTLRRLRRRPVTRIGLMVKVRNRPARRFYEKYGFEKVRLVRGYYENGSDGILMSREIKRVRS
jgi:[ribosomal protein S18]-alanine N-acetyltransferase